MLSYDGIDSIEILDDGNPVPSDARGHSSSLVLRIHLKDGAQRDIRALSTAQSRKGFAYNHTLEQLRFLMSHLDEVRS